MRISNAGLIVERVESGSPAERAGILRGYRLLTYQGQPLTSPSLLKALEDNTFFVEQVTLLIEWEGQRTELLVPPGRLGVETRLDLPETMLDLFRRGQDAFLAQETTEAARLWREAAQSIQEPVAAAWLFVQAGKAWEEVPNWQSARACYESACERVSAGQDIATLVTAWVAIGKCLLNTGELEAASQRYAQAQQASEQADWLAWTANAVHVQGMIAFYVGELTQAERFFARAVAFRERSAPQSPDMAESLNDQGLVAWKCEDLTRAHDCFVRALNIQENIARDTEAVAVILNNLGLVACKWGDMERAEEYHLRALSIWNRPPTDRQKEAMSLGNLGAVAYAHDDLARSEAYYSRAVAIGLTLNLSQPEAASLLAECHISLGNIACQRDDLERAERSFREALNILEGFAPGSLDVAISLSGLGSAGWMRGDLERAQGRQDRAGEYDTQAEDHWDRAAAIFESIAPVSLDYADALMERGKAALRQDRAAQSLAHLQRALDIVEQQRARLVAPQARALLVARHTAKYAALIQSYHALDDPATAFLTLERARIRSFLELLAQRDLDFTDAPQELLNARHEVDIKRAYALEQRRQLSTIPANAEPLNHLRRMIRDLDREWDELTAHVCAASPRFAALQYPHPLPLTEAQRQLAKGMLLLSYFVEEEQTFLFAITRKTVRIHVLPLGRAALQKKTNAFRSALNPTLLENQDGEQAITLGRELYADLILPAGEMLGGVKRLLLCQDGPLHTLPFGAFVTNPNGPPRYLGAEKTLHSTLSLTLYAQTREQKPVPPTQQTRRLFALGDPLYAPGVPGSAPKFKPLPNTREEVEYLGQLFGRDADKRLDVQATKTAVLTDSRTADILHLACHGWFDSKTPLSSGLALSDPEMLGADAPPEDNGRLEAREIFQHLKLQADLVVLSACWTGVGQEVRGEGLIGLTRAFQYAGANSLVVSLWAVNDACTSLFMQSFYAALKVGHSKDEALRQGVTSLQQHPEWKHPYFWSAFVLIGDPRNVAGPEELLIRQAQQGKREAFEALDKRYRTDITSYCERLLKGEEDASEAAQKALLLAWKYLHTFRLEAPFIHWIKRISTHVCKEMLHKKVSLGIIEPSYEEPAIQHIIDMQQAATESEETGMLSLLAEQCSEVIARHAQALKPPWNAIDRIIYSHHCRKGMTLAAIAKWLNLNAATLRDRKRRRIMPILRAAAREMGLK